MQNYHGIMKKFVCGIMTLTMFCVFGGKLMAKEVLTPKQKNIVLISVYTAKSDLENLEKALHVGLDEGLTVNEIKEVLVQAYAYCGFPKSLNGLTTFEKVMDARRDKNDKVGEEGKHLPEGTDKFAYGDDVQFKLTGKRYKGGIFDFAPAIDEYLKEHLFADIFARGVLSYQERETATIAILSALQTVPAQLNSHIKTGKHNGLTDEQVSEILQLTEAVHKGGDFGLGEENTKLANYFTGKCYVNELTKDGVRSANVTFEPTCRNNWHIRYKGGQILMVTEGRGYYQEWGKEAQELKAGDVVNIPAETKHWHGAAKDSWFSHIAISVPAEGAATQWLEEVSDEEYAKLK